MPGEHWELEVYWGERQEDEFSCAKRLARMVQGLAQVDSNFDRWLKQSMRRPKYEPQFAMPPSVKELERQFHRNRQYYDDPPDKLWPEMGFDLSAWNGRDDDYGGNFLVFVGRYGFSLGPSNSVCMDLGRKSETRQAPWISSQMKRILSAVVEAWEPQYALVTSSKMSRLIPHAPNFKAICPMPGWLTYLRQPYSLCVHPPSEIAVERFPDQSMIATLCEEPFESDEPRHQDLLAEMNAALRPAQKIWRWDPE